MVSYICLAGFLGSLIFTTRAGLLILDITDHFITNYGLIMGGIVECFIVGWLLKASVARQHVNNSGGKKLSPLWDICVRFLTPALLLILILQALMGELRNTYGGYTADSLILFGVDWLMITLVASVVFTFYPWKPEMLRKRHSPEQDHLLT